MPGEFRPSDQRWRRLEPLLPHKPRGAPWADDRRVIGGIVHMLRSGGRWVDASAIYGPRKTLYSGPLRALGRQGRVGRGLPDAGRGGRATGA